MEDQLKQVDEILRVLRESMGSPTTPGVLVQPRLQKMGEIKERLLEASTEVRSAGGAGVEPTEAELKELDARELRVARLIAQVSEEVAGEPWVNPVAQRKLKKSEATLSTELEQLCRVVKKICRKGESKYNNIRMVNMNDAEDVKASGMNDEVPSRMQNRMRVQGGGFQHIYHAMGGTANAEKINDTFGPKAHMALTLHRALFAMC